MPLLQSLALSTCAVLCAGEAANQDKTLADESFVLDALNYDGGPRLLVTVSPYDEGGHDLLARRLLLDTGSGGLAFCDTGLEKKLNSHQTPYYDCGTYGVGAADASGYWGHLYNGTIRIHRASADVVIRDIPFGVMHQEFSMPCTSGFEGIFGINLLSSTATVQKPQGWSRTHVGSCPPPQPSPRFPNPLMQYIHEHEVNTQLGIYWSGEIGQREGSLYLGNAAWHNPYFDAAAARQIGGAKLNMDGDYNVYIQTMEYGGRSHDIQCRGNDWNCVIDTGTPTLSVPQDMYDAMMEARSGELVINLESVDGGLVKLRFDVGILVKKSWVEPCSMFLLGLPLRAFYYTVMDVTHSVLYFSPMAKYFGAVDQNSSWVMV